MLRIVILGFLLNVPGSAQDLEPNALSRAPVGMNIFVLGYGYSSGNIFLDPALPIEGTEAKVHSLSAVFVTVLNLFDRTAKLEVIAPFANGIWHGLVNGEAVSTERTGFGDPMVRLSVNFLGAPALSGREFLAHKSKYLLGGSLRIRIPLGQYDETKLVNLGTHRWMTDFGLALKRTMIAAFPASMSATVTDTLS